MAARLRVVSSDDFILPKNPKTQTKKKKRFTGFRKYVLGRNELADYIENKIYVLDISIPKLAAYAEISASAIYKIVNRETLYPRSDTLFKLSKALGMRVTFNSDNTVSIEDQD